MISGFGPWLAQGFTHVWSVEGLHHILFVAVLAAAFDPRHWRAVVVLLSGFTVADAAVLAVAAAGRMPSAVAPPWSEVALWVLVLAAVATHGVARGLRRRVSPAAGPAVGSLRASVREGPSSAAHFGWDGPLGAGGLLAWRYAMVVTFGLVHGFVAVDATRSSAAAAGPSPMGLFAFDLGVEIGQWVVALVVVLAAGWVAGRADG